MTKIDIYLNDFVLCRKDNNDCQRRRKRRKMERKKKKKKKTGRQSVSCCVRQTFSNVRTRIGITVVNLTYRHRDKMVRKDIEKCGEEIALEREEEERMKEEEKKKRELESLLTRLGSFS